MNLAILFVLLLLISFAVLLYFLRPSQLESAVKAQLERIETGMPVTAVETTILKQQAPSSAPWLDQFLQEAPGAGALSRLIQQSDKRWAPSYLVVGSLLAAGATWWIMSLLTYPFFALLLAIAAGVAPYVYLAVLRQVKFMRCDAALPEAIDLMSRALRAGHATSSALEMVGKEVPDPLGAEFRMLHEEQSLGLPTREAILNLVKRVPSDDIRFLATAILVQGETGGNLTQILDKTGAVMRERARLRGQLRIYTAQGRITGWILCSMPFVMFGLISLTNPSYEKILLTDELGLHVVYAGLVMMIIGVLVIRKIIDIKV